MGAPAGARRPLAWFLGVAAATVALDQLTKAAAVAALSPGRSIPLLGEWVRLSLVHNAGAAFGMLPVGWLLVGIGLLFCLVVPVVVFRRPGLAVRQASVLGLIWAGSAANVIDRLRTGAVIDFVDLRVWPVFNVADIAITAGFVALVWPLVTRRS